MLFSVSETYVSNFLNWLVFLNLTLISCFYLNYFSLYNTFCGDVYWLWWPGENQTLVQCLYIPINKNLSSIAARACKSYLFSYSLNPEYGVQWELLISIWGEIYCSLYVPFLFPCKLEACLSIHYIRFYVRSYLCYHFIGFELLYCFVSSEYLTMLAIYLQFLLFLLGCLFLHAFLPLQSRACHNWRSCWALRDWEA